jgi:hypothetical protein
LRALPLSLSLSLSLSLPFFSQSSIAFFSCISICFDFTRGGRWGGEVFQRDQVGSRVVGGDWGWQKTGILIRGLSFCRASSCGTSWSSDCRPAAVWGGGKKVKNLNS